MTSRRTKFLFALPVLALLIVGIAGYWLWGRLTQQPTDPRRGEMVVRPADDGSQKLADSDDLQTAIVDLKPRDMPRIAPGTVIGAQLPAGWSNLILHGTPRVAEGDVGKVSSLLVRLVSLFHLTIVADVEKDSAASPPRYTLRQVALGIATDVDGKETIVSSTGPSAHTAHLGVVERSSLAGNEANLAQALEVARTPTMLVFDATAVLRRDGKNLPVIERHAVLVSPADGRLSTFVWVLVRNDAGQLQLVEPKIRLLDAAIEEDRKLYVDAGLFVFGLPAQEAFALVDLPPGQDISLDDAQQTIVDTAIESADNVRQLEQELRASAERAASTRAADAKPPFKE